MIDLTDMIWIEFRKAIRSRMPLWTTLGSLFMPLGVGFLIFLAKNPELARKLGLVSAKANLIAYSATDWQSYLVLYAEILSAVGFFFFIMATSWVFGREFVDGTLKDMLAVPVHRSSILLAKFCVVIAWSVLMAITIFIFGLIVGVILQLPGGSATIILNGSATIGITVSLVIAVVLPFAFFASVGRGYLLPIGIAVLTVIMANFVMVVGRAEYFPWSIPILVSQSASPLSPVSYAIVVVTCLGGMFATYLWWMFADQNR